MPDQKIASFLNKHDDVMYRLLEEPDLGLRTGDVVRLIPEDFESILKSYPLMKPVLESYFNNPSYKSHFWAILNKPCDMVEGRKMKSNLFLAPLQSFLAELRIGGIFEEYVEAPLSIKKPKDILEMIYQKFSEKFVKSLLPIGNKDLKPKKIRIGKERSQFVNEQTAWAESQIFSKFEDEIDNPQEVITNLISFRNQVLIPMDDPNKDCISKFIEELSDNKAWISYENDFREQVKSVTQVRLKGGRSDLQKITSNVFLNQMESRGRFYYEPCLSLYCKEQNDISYFIELEDLLTLKISGSAIEHGLVIKALQDKRVAGLTRNYSDRLQNIMGYYFSKIGTKDVKSQDVISLYDKLFENFILIQKSTDKS